MPPLTDSVGAQVITIFAKEYVQARFPRLPRDSHEMATQIYAAPKNVAVIARSLGLEYALIPFSGIPSIKMPTINAHLDSIGATIKPAQLYCEVMQAIVGLILTQKVG